MDKLIDKIRRDFEKHPVLEIFILDENGEPMEIFSGSSNDLSEELLSEVLAMPGCFYMFSIVGIEYGLVDSGRVTRHGMIRKEFCWLTEPTPPRMVTRKGKTITLEWDPAICCGLDPMVINPHVNYLLEVSEGHEWVPGGIHHFATGTVSNEFKLMARGIGMTKLIVQDLKPAQWYHWRLGVEYMGSVVYSESRPVPSLRAVPEAPSRPRVKVLKSKSQILPDDAAPREIRLRIFWSAPYANGAAIERYQLQVKEDLDIALIGPESWAHAPIAGTGSHGDEDGDHMGMIGLIPPPTDARILKQWTTVYSKQYTEAILPPPQKGVAEWRFRVRAKNSEGYSFFSIPLVINRQTHPSLFIHPPESSSMGLPFSSFPNLSSSQYMSTSQLDPITW
jgi:hypothetical protein